MCFRKYELRILEKFLMPIIFIIILFNPLYFRNSRTFAEMEEQPSIKLGQLIQSSTQTEDRRSSSNEDIIPIAQLVINSSQLVIKYLQSLFTIQAIFTGLVGFASIGLVLFYRNKVEKSQEQIKEVKVVLDDLGDSLKTMALELKEIEKKESLIKDSISEFETARDSLEFQYKNLSKNADALHCVLLIKDPNPKIRLEHLQRLVQIVHPVGILPMIEFLKDQDGDEHIRLEAALGLGRYAEDKDLDGYWSQIINGLGTALQDSNLPDTLAIEVIISLAKFGKDARGFFNLMLEWSRSSKQQIRRICAEAFGKSKVLDNEIIQRLKEMQVSDHAEEVKMAATIALTSLDEIRETQWNN